MIRFSGEIDVPKFSACKYCIRNFCNDPNVATKVLTQGPSSAR